MTLGCPERGSSMHVLHTSSDHRPSTSAGRSTRDYRGVVKVRLTEEDEPQVDTDSLRRQQKNHPQKKKKSQTTKTKQQRTSSDGTCRLTSILGTEEGKLREQLLIACERGKKHATYLLLHQGMDKDRCRGMNGYSPLHHAAARGHLEIVQLLLDFGWNANVSNDSLETPLHLACFNGHLGAAECLLDRGANINALTSDHETPLFYATRKNHHRIVRLLIRRECDLLVQNRFGDVAEDEASHEKTQLEFMLGKEDCQRLYSKNSSQTRASREVTGEQTIFQQQREYILSFLDLRSVCLASQVSYRWHRAADNPSLWKRLGVSRWELLLSSTMGIGVIAPMMNFTSGLQLKLSTGTSCRQRPSSCNQVGSFASQLLGASSINRKYVGHRRMSQREQQRPQTAQNFINE